MILRLTTEDKKATKRRIISIAIFSIIFCSTFLFPEDLPPSFIYIYNGLFICASIFWMKTTIFTKGYLFIGQLSILDDKIQINHNNLTKDILSCNITVIVVTIAGECGRSGTAFDGLSGATNKIEIYAREGGAVFNFYLGNVPEIKRLRTRLKQFGEKNPNVRIKIIGK